MSDQAFVPANWGQLRTHRLTRYARASKLATLLRLSEVRLRAFEEGRFQDLKLSPPKLESFLRRYCERTGIDTGAALELYRGMVDEAAPPPPQETHNLVTMLVVLLAIAPFAFFMLDGEPAETSQPAATQVRAASASRPAAGASAVTLQAGLSVRFHSDCWTVIRQGGEVLRDRLYSAGDHLQLAGEDLADAPIDLWLGDANAAEVVYDGVVELAAQSSPAAEGIYLRLGEL